MILAYAESSVFMIIWISADLTWPGYFLLALNGSFALFSPLFSNL